LEEDVLWGDVFVAVAVLVDRGKAHVDVVGQFQIDLEVFWFASMFLDELFQVSALHKSEIRRPYLSSTR